MKLIKKLFALAVVLALLVAIASWFLVPSAAKGAVEQGSRYAFGVPTTLAHLGAKLGFGTSGLALEGYRVASPAGFEGDPLLEVGKLAVGVGTRSLFGEPKVIDEIVIEGLELHLVQKGTESNLLPVLQQVRKLAAGDATPPPDAGGDSGPGPRLQVKRIRIAGLAASIDLSGIPGLDAIEKRFELPAYDADWTALSGPDGVTVAELAGKLMEQVSVSALDAADKVVPGPAMKLLRATLDGGLAGGLGGALDAAQDAAKDAAQKGLDQAQERLKSEADALKDKGAKELDKVKEAVGGALGGALDSALGKDGASAPQDAAKEGAAAVGAKADEVEKKAAEGLEKLKQEADEKANNALKGASKKLFGGGGK
ncbi:MAG: hypothetical protein R3F49_19885 [Planctomycetota bacterium]